MTRLTITFPVNGRNHVSRFQTHYHNNRRRTGQGRPFEYQFTNFSMIVPRVLVIASTKARQGRFHTISCQTATSNRGRTSTVLLSRSCTFRHFIRSQIQHGTKRLSSFTPNSYRYDRCVIVNAITFGQSTTVRRRGNTLSALRLLYSVTHLPFTRMSLRQIVRGRVSRTWLLYYTSISLEATCLLLPPVYSPSPAHRHRHAPPQAYSPRPGPPSTPPRPRGHP